MVREFNGKRGGVFDKKWCLKKRRFGAGVVFYEKKLSPWLKQCMDDENRSKVIEIWIQKGKNERVV